MGWGNIVAEISNKGVSAGVPAVARSRVEAYPGANLWWGVGLKAELRFAGCLADMRLPSWLRHMVTSAAAG